VIDEPGEREQVLVAAWLTGLRAARTRRAYAGGVAAWLGPQSLRKTDEPTAEKSTLAPARPTKI
jgi:hypothetical protein